MTTPYITCIYCFFFRLRAGTVIGLADNVSCLLSVLLEPYMPETSSIIQAQLNTPKTVNVTTDTLVCWLKEGHQIGTVSAEDI